MKGNTAGRSIGIQPPHKDTGCGLKSTRPKTVEIQDVGQGEKEKMLIYHTTYREKIRKAVSVMNKTRDKPNL